MQQISSKSVQSDAN